MIKRIPPCQCPHCGSHEVFVTGQGVIECEHCQLKTYSSGNITKLHCTTTSLRKPRGTNPRGSFGTDDIFDHTRREE